MKIKDIKQVSDLREMNTNDVIDVLDELRDVATKRGTELLAQGKKEARRAIGAPSEGAVGTAFVVGILLGAAVAAVFTMLMSPLPAPEARRKLREQVDTVRDKMPVRPDGNGRATYEYEHVTPSGEVGATSGSIPRPTA